MKTILVATDFSEHSRIAGQTGLRLARRFDANLACVHASRMADNAPDHYQLSQAQLDEFRQVLQNNMAQERKWLKLITDEAGRQGVKAFHQLVDGSPADAICATAKEVDADLVIVGSHGHTGIKRFLLGSIAEAVVRQCHTSVLVARPPTITEHGFRHVLVPVDFEKEHHAVEWARHLVTDDATIDILHTWQLSTAVDGLPVPSVPAAVHSTMVGTIIENAKQCGEQLVHQLEGGNRRVTLHLQEGYPSDAIQSFMEAQSVMYDLVCVGTHGRRRLERLLLGSVAEATVRYSPCSVLVARSRQQ